ncbi:response regulator transcription factor [Halomonas halocynthiae]|uniref:response regulator transcription factor n=1 Tax=Halomonas halocynthiae TaxID=176290 RepID=UPI0004890EDD|nr:response regulator transcription factor [Halomonas halocynthiae]
MRIAVLDDDRTSLEQMCQALAESTKELPDMVDIQAFHTAADFVRALKRDTFKLVMLDWEMPDSSGIELLEWIHGYFDVPPAVIMVTNRNSEEDVVEALGKGAADFLSKPFRPLELKARAFAVLRRQTRTGMPNGGAENAELVCGNILIDQTVGTVFVDGEEVKLTRQEYRLIYQFFVHLGRPLARAYLYEYIWGREERPGSRTLDVHVYRIRKKLGLEAQKGWNLVSVYGYGYRLQALSEGEAEA